MSRDEKRRRPRQVAPARVAPGPLHELTRLLYRLYVEAGTSAFDDIAARIGADDRLAGAPSGDTVRRCVTGPELPANQADAVAVAAVLARLARWDPNTAAGQVRELWTQERLHPTPPLRNISRWAPERLGVHRAIHVGADNGSGLSPVTGYVERDHDRRLRARLNSATRGESVLVVLVGGSCTGKTRAMY